MGSCFTLFNEAAAATTPVDVRSLLRYVKCSAIGLRGEGDYSKAEGTAGGREAGWLRGLAGGLAGERGLLGISWEAPAVKQQLR